MVGRNSKIRGRHLVMSLEAVWRIVIMDMTDRIEVEVTTRILMMIGTMAHMVVEEDPGQGLLNAVRTKETKIYASKGAMAKTQAICTH